MSCGVPPRPRHVPAWKGAYRGQELGPKVHSQGTYRAAPLFCFKFQFDLKPEPRPLPLRKRNTSQAQCQSATVQVSNIASLLRTNSDKSRTNSTPPDGARRSGSGTSAGGSFPQNNTVSIRSLIRLSSRLRLANPLVTIETVLSS